jgi:hypothetical protein
VKEPLIASMRDFAANFDKLVEQVFRLLNVENGA